MGGGRKRFPSFKRGALKVYPVFGGEGTKGFGPVVFPTFSPPPPPPTPVINDRSLSLIPSARLVYKINNQLLESVFVGWRRRQDL